MKERFSGFQAAVCSKRIALRKRDLTIRLQSIKRHPEPKVRLEQYTVPADIAAEILFRACYVHNDIEGKSVIDLGTGTGRLAIGAALLGADYVIGVDSDEPALKNAQADAKRLSLQIDWVLGEIDPLRGRVDTVVMNPPFGTKEEHADTNFLRVALRLATVVYSVHKASTRGFLVRWLDRHEAQTEVIISDKLEIAHQFPFHRKKRKYVDVDVYRILQK